MREEDLKISQLITEVNLSKALGISKQALYQCRREGCPWFSLGGRPYYHQTIFMEWLLKARRREADKGADKK